MSTTHGTPLPQPASTPGPHPFDLPDAAALRARGSLKWTTGDAEIAAWVAESDLGVADVVLDAVRAAVDRPLLGYMPPLVRQDMASACAAWLEEHHGWTVPAARVVPVGDVLAALRVAVDHFSRPGSPVVLPTPAYMPFVTSPAVWGREVIQVPMVEVDGRPTLDLDGLARAFEAGGHLLVLVNPHNPTGRVMERTELEQVAAVVERYGGRVFADEIHAPLVHPGHTHIPYASVSEVTAGHTLTATSASKAWNVPGLKCAQIILSNDADVAAWAPLDHLLTVSASPLGAVAAAAAYRHGGQWLDEVLAYLDGNRRAFADALGPGAGAGGPLVPHRSPEGTYLAWVDLRAAGPERLAARLRAATGVMVTDGAACGEAGRGFVRVNLAMPRPLVVDAARRISGWVTTQVP